MKPAKQTKDFSVCLEGLTLPMNVIYGNVSGVTYYYNPETKKLSIYDKYVRKWRFAKPDKYTRIMHYVHDFIRHEYVADKVRYCQHKQDARNKAFADNKRLNRDLVKKHLRHERELKSVLPHERRANYEYLPTREHTYSQRAIEGKSFQSLTDGENAAVYTEDGLKLWSDRGFKATIKNDKYIVRKEEENPIDVKRTTNDGGKYLNGKVQNLGRPAINAYDPNNNTYIVVVEEGRDVDYKLVTITKRDGMAIKQTKIRPDKTGGSRDFKVSRNGGKQYTIRETVTDGKSVTKII